MYKDPHNANDISSAVCFGNDKKKNECTERGINVLEGSFRFKKVIEINRHENEFGHRGAHFSANVRQASHEFFFSVDAI